MAEQAPRATGPGLKKAARALMASCGSTSWTAARTVCQPPGHWWPGTRAVGTPAAIAQAQSTWITGHDRQGFLGRPVPGLRYPSVGNRDLGPCTVDEPCSTLGPDRSGASNPGATRSPRRSTPPHRRPGDALGAVSAPIQLTTESSISMGGGDRSLGEYTWPPVRRILTRSLGKRWLRLFWCSDLGTALRRPDGLVVAD